MGIFEKLSWDTNFFGYDVARIIAPSLEVYSLISTLSDMKKQQIRLVYWFVDPEDKEVNNAASENGGLLVDTKIMYTWSLGNSAETTTSSKILSYKGREMTKQLQSLALQSGEYSRYNIDPHFVHNEYKKLFTEWMKASLEGKIAKDVLVYEEDEKALGVIVIGEKDGRCDIILLAVDEKSRGKSIGRKLIEAAFVKAKEQGYTDIQVVTQKANAIACSFYEALGFKEEKATNVYHFWL